MPDPTEQAIVDRYHGILAEIRSHRLPGSVAELEAGIDHVRDPATRGEIAHLLGFFWLRRGNPAKALRFSDAARALLPDKSDCAYNAIFALLQMGRWAEAAARAQGARARFGEMFKWHGVLCTAYGHLGHFDQVRLHGTRSLALKDAAVRGSVQNLSSVPVPRFDPTRPERNAVSFSLFGDNEKYLRTAVLNASAVRFLYLGWSCRFHVDDSVPAPVIQGLRDAGAWVGMVRGLPADPFGAFWRFLVADDAAVDRYIVRDADSAVNIREAAAVQEWLASDRHFHVMRDHFDHDELILAGMWGGVRGALPPVLPAAQRHLAARTDLPGRTADQEFLRTQLWSTIRTSLMTHDSQFGFGEHRDFPAAVRLPQPHYVGCDGRAMRNLPPTVPTAG